MSQKKLDNLFSGMPNVSSITDDIVTAGSEKQRKDHDDILDEVLWVCKQINFKTGQR